MKREILFRGIRIDGGGWVEGDLVQDCDLMKDECSHYYETAIIDDGEVTEVIPETVGQYVKETVWAGKKMRIFVGDKVKVLLPYDETAYTAEVVYDVRFSAFSFLVDRNNGKYYHNFGTITVVDIIGTIHDHLLEEKQ
jgi:hypothetical protein